MTSRSVNNITSRRFRRKTVLLYRPTLGAMVDGEMPAPTYPEDPTPFTAICQPAGGDDLKILTEGQRLNNVQAVWAPVPLYVGNGKDRESDVLEVDGVRYTVIKMFDRSNHGFYKVLAEGYVHG